MLRPILFSVFCLCTIPKAYSWGDVGHQTVGEIAERILTSKAKQSINNILGPDKLAIVSTWPDSIKDDPEFNSFKAFHFIDTTAPKDLLTVMNKYPVMIKSPSEERSVKIIALKYLIHVIGDIHQPLHAGIKNDRGGNLCMVNWDDQILNLHSVWDGKIVAFDISKLKQKYSLLKYYSYMTYADDILKLIPMTDADKIKVQASQIDSWIKESEEAENVVYPNQDTDSYCKGVITNPPKITDQYKNKAIEITRMRILYAGLRLGSFLNEMFAGDVTPGLNGDLTKAQILSRLNVSN